MKKIIIVVVLLLCGYTQSFATEAAKTQLQLTIGESFLEKERFSGFAFASFLYNVNNGYPVVIGYAGPKLTIGKVDLYGLLAVMGEPIGLSVGPSFWLAYSKDKDSIFLEFDHYASGLPAEHGDNAIVPEASYFVLAKYGHKFEKVTIGIAGEVIGYYDDLPFELAYGPYVQFGKLKVWTAFDETPNIEGHEYLLLRLTFGL